jgi:hypothetical protein
MAFRKGHTVMCRENILTGDDEFPKQSLLQKIKLNCGFVHSLKSDTINKTFV